MHFEFATATRIIFGPGMIREISNHAHEIGNRVFVVTGRTEERALPLLDLLRKKKIAYDIFHVTDEPTTALVYDGVARARESRCASVIGIGGGSVLDTGKVIAALLTNSGDLLNYLEVIGKGHHLEQAPAYYVAIPTTAGTGAEVTRNAAIKSIEHSVKVSIRSPLLLPRLAVIDPELTYSMPPEVTASTGLDALTQLMEAYVSNRANPITDGICAEGLKRAAQSLYRVFDDGADVAARENMSIASLFGGLALANAKLGAVHGYAGVIGGTYNAPHGVICARLLPYVMQANVKALQTRMPASQVLARYKEVAQILTGKISADVADGVEWVRHLFTALKIPHLAEYGLHKKDFTTIVAMAKKASSMKGNPIDLTDDELLEILDNAI
jgi:alcohol dehydrogenase class IV